MQRPDGAEPDQRRQIALFADGITAQLERVRPLDDVLRSAAAQDDEVARRLWDVSEELTGVTYRWP